ncbi:MAG: hypothetical protein FWG15_08670 [Propionibacteriaceae bacterium]|nr:hypothetical protein [Propionibacteriaceae bacterium]
MNYEDNEATLRDWEDDAQARDMINPLIVKEIMRPLHESIVKLSTKIRADESPAETAIAQAWISSQLEDLLPMETAVHLAKAEKHGVLIQRLAQVVGASGSSHLRYTYPEMKHMLDAMKAADLTKTAIKVQGRKKPRVKNDEPADPRGYQWTVKISPDSD